MSALRRAWASGAVHTTAVFVFILNRLLFAGLPLIGKWIDETILAAFVVAALVYAIAIKGRTFRDRVLAATLVAFVLWNLLSAWINGVPASIAIMGIGVTIDSLTLVLSLWILPSSRIAALHTTKAFLIMVGACVFVALAQYVTGEGWMGDWQAWMF